ncbi:MAG: VOC family protein [Myxococcales bacterium]|nr:VOC family protein [Myxococcales bacterium]
MSGLHHLALRVAEPTASARFYVEVLGLRELQVHRDEDGTARSVWLALGEGVLMLERSLRPPGANEGSAHVLVLACADLEAAARGLAAAGLEIVARTTFTLYFHDPDGHRVGLSAYRFG